VRRARAAHDDGEDVDLGTWPVGADGICEGCVFGTNQVGCLGELVVCALFPFFYLNLFNGRVAPTTVCVTDESRFEEADKVGFVCGGP
jgi:hypothetical protein